MIIHGPFVVYAIHCANGIMGMRLMGAGEKRDDCQGTYTFSDFGLTFISMVLPPSYVSPSA